MAKARKSAAHHSNKNSIVRPTKGSGASRRRPLPGARRASGTSGEKGAIGRFAPRGLAVAVEPILKIQGYADTKRALPAVRGMAESVVGIVNRVVAPDVRYRRVGIVKVSDGVLELANGIKLHCRAFDRHLAGCREAIVFVLALGEGFDRIAENFGAKGQLLESVLFEAAGWMAVEQATKQFVRHLREAEGLSLTRRMAPGYRFSKGGESDEWPLTEQTELFALFAGADLPVRLLESSAMWPKMSRSGLYGVNPASVARDE